VNGLAVVLDERLSKHTAHKNQEFRNDRPAASQLWAPMGMSGSASSGNRPKGENDIMGHLRRINRTDGVSGSPSIAPTLPHRSNNGLGHN
jgi:hypothetical protein